jgi:hypothetical protein
MKKIQLSLQEIQNEINRLIQELNLIMIELDKGEQPHSEKKDR